MKKLYIFLVIALSAFSNLFAQEINVSLNVDSNPNPEISEIAISTGIVSNIDRTTCIVTGNISSLGEGISNHGFCWAETSNPTTNDAPARRLNIHFTTSV